MSDAATRAATPITTIVNATIAEFVRALARLFRVTLPAAEETVLHWVLLGVVLCIGTVVRFWNLGGPGLHGDEETMAMAAMHIVQNGWPILPSGMFYPRGLSELYLMAASVQIFGESEWAFRLPSALAGVATIYLCYVAGRRFLRPQWNIALAATVGIAAGDDRVLADGAHVHLHAGVRRRLAGVHLRVGAQRAPRLAHRRRARC